MKLDSAVIIAKGICLCTIPLVSTFAGGLSQLGLQRVAGVPVALMQLLCAAYVAGAGGLLAFISSSFSDYTKSRNGNGNGNGNGYATAPLVPVRSSQTLTPPAEAPKTGL